MSTTTRPTSNRWIASLLASSLLWAPLARADENASPPSPTVKFTGYVQGYYQVNFNFPDNLITAYRGFDNRSNSFTIEDAVLDTTGTVGAAYARLALQIGHAPASYYLAEPSLPAEAGVGPSTADLWRIIQQAYLGVEVPVGNGLTTEAGIFLSPIGVENIAIKDQWNWSRSNLFYALPYYHSGVRVSYPFTSRFTGVVYVVNGWNNIVNKNWYPCVSGALAYTIPDRLTVNVLYFGGVEQALGSPEGQPWRHLFDLNATWNIRPWLAVAAQADAGSEHNAFGVSSWASGALYARVRVRPWLAVSGRVDYFHSSDAVNALGAASRLFFPADHVSSQTATADFRPVENLSVRFEYRHDWASSPMFFRGAVRGVDGASMLNAGTQNTLTVGATTWF